MFQRWTKVSFQLLTAVVLFLPLTMERVPENTHNFTRSGRSCCWKTGISWKDNTSIWMIWNSIDYINYVYICIYIYTHYFMHWKFKIIANLFSQIWFQLIFISESKLHCSQVGSPCIKPETRVRNVPKVLWLQISYRSLQRQENHGIGKHITLGSHEKHEALRLCGYPWNLDRLTVWPFLASLQIDLGVEEAIGTNHDISICNLAGLSRTASAPETGNGSVENVENVETGNPF